MSWFRRVVGRRLSRTAMVEAARTVLDEAVPRTDALTGLLSRSEMQRALERLERRGTAGVVLVIDLDHFKTVNDRFGHLAGDTVLKTVAARLLRCSPPDATVTRMGGEEFAVVLSQATLEDGRALAERIRSTIEQPVVVDGRPRVITASVGVARATARRGTRALVVADRCLYQAKTLGRNTVVVEGDHGEVRAGRYDLVQQFHQMQDQRDALAALALTDELTGLPNRRAFDSALHELDSSSRRAGQPYAMVYMDLDRFHDLNRSRGDAAGDEALRLCASALSSVCRDEDAVYRKGGEELVALLPVTDLGGARLTAERLRLAVADLRIPYDDDPDAATVTISGGIAVLDPSDPASERLSADEVMGRANRGMLQAKDDGRDRMVAI